mgnify:CR=1 FL=1
MKNIKELIKRENIDLIDFKISDFIGNLQHITIPACNFTSKFLKDGIGFDGSNYKFAKVENSDMVLKPDLDKYFIDEFYSHRVLSFIADSFIADTGEENLADPRNICKKTLELFQEKGIADEIMFGPEYEFHIFDDVKFEYSSERSFFQVFSRQSQKNSGNDFSNKGFHISSASGYHASLPNDTYADLRNEMTLTLGKMGIPVKYHHHEVGGAGQMEIETNFMNILDAADNSQLIRYVVKNIAKKYDKTATFMPKPIDSEAGNGFHAHMFMKKDGKNIFAGKKNGELSKTALYAIGGVLKNVKSLVALTNPSTNSYKRLIPGFEAPVKIFFGKANRSAAIRVPAYVKSKEFMRFEYRTMDSMCNPYIAFSALALAMLDGIENKIDPTKMGYGPFDVNVFTLPEEQIKSIDSLPATFDQALRTLVIENDFITKYGTFPKIVLDKYIEIKYKEFMNVTNKISPYEYLAYYDF